MSKTYKSATGSPRRFDSVLTRDECQRRASNAKNAAESYRGWLSDCREMVAEAQTDPQKRIAQGFVHVAELRMRFESSVAEIYERLAKGGEAAP